MKTLTIKKVIPLEKYRVQIEWSNGKTTEIDFQTAIPTNKRLESLRNPIEFKTVSVDEWGHGLSWTCGVDICADTLWRLAHEQAGLALPVEEFDAWMKRHRLSSAAAAEILGITRRTVIYYHMGHRPIPKMVGLACKGYEALLKEKARKRVA